MSTPMAITGVQRPGTVSVIMGGCVSLAVSLALRSVRFDRVTAVLRLAARSTTRPASTEEVLRVLNAVDEAARFLPVRIACLERATSTVLILAARRRGVTFHHGVKTPPLAAHAWVANSQGNPIGEPSTTASYRILFTISPTTTNRSTT